MSDRPTQPHQEQEAMSPRASDGWASVSTLLAGILAWGGVGWVADALLGFQALFLPVGMVLGLVGGVYLVYVKTLRS